MSMTLPRSSYGGGYYAAPSYPDTPIYDLLVSERGTPQIAPIRVPAEYTAGNNLPALPSALPALPSGQGSSQQQYAPQGYPGGYQQSGPPHQGAQQPAPLQQAPAPYLPQQAQAPQRGGYPTQWPQPQQAGYQQAPQRPQQPQAPQPYQQAQQPQQPYQQAQQPPRMQPVRPAVPRQMPSPYEDQHGGQQYPGRGY